MEYLSNTSQIQVLCVKNADAFYIDDDSLCQLYNSLQT